MIRLKKVLLSIPFLLTSVLVGATEYKQLTNIPTMYVTTADSLPITSKTEYVYCTIVVVNGTDTAVYKKTKIRGRGNSTWTDLVNSDKYPYRIKFNKKQELLGADFANAKDWVLLANAGDKSLLRNATSYAVGKYIGMPFCPAVQFVDLYLNGEYRGNYQITDQKEVGEKRINIDKENGWILEFCQSLKKSDPPYFSWGDYGLMSMKNPKNEYLTDGVKVEMEEAATELLRRLQSTDTLHTLPEYSDPRNGYRAMIDTFTFINYYLAAEIMCDWDINYSFNIYRDIDSDRFFYGPLWDKDLAFNNSSEIDLYDRIVTITDTLGNSDGSLGSTYRPLSRVFRDFVWKDPWFMNAVTMRFNELYESGMEAAILSYVDSMTNVVRRSAEENYKIWPINFATIPWGRYNSYNTYDEYVNQLKDIISCRFKVLKPLLSEMNADNRYMCATSDYSYGEETGVNVVLHRNADAGVWSSICLPFSMTAEEMINMFGENTSLASFTRVNGDTLRFSVSSDLALTAGVPYLIKPALDVVEPFSLPNRNLIASAKEVVKVCNGNCYVFKSTYSPIALDAVNLSLCIGDSKLFTEDRLDGFSAYFDIPLSSSKVTIVIDDSTTGISSVVDDGDAERRIHDLIGVEHKTTQPGNVYIIEGKKIVVE